MIFFYNNLWDDETILESTQHENFPSENTQHRDFNKPWRTNYGAGSGWGRFNVGAGVNDRIDFDEGGGELTANLTPAVYDADTLCAHLKTIMDAAGAHTYTWTYVESGASINKFKCTDGTGNVAFPWKTGTNGSDNTGRTVGDTIGFDETADDGAAASHTADEIRIHKSEYISFQRSATIDVYGMMVRGHNIQSGATVYFQGSDDNFATTPVSISPTIQDDILVYIWSSVQQRQDWRIWIEDVDNPDGYVELGRVFVGGQFQPAYNLIEMSHAPIDPSINKYSEGGQIVSVQNTKYFRKTYSFIVPTEKSSFESVFTELGTSKDFFLCETPASYLTTTKYVRFVDWYWTEVTRGGTYWKLDFEVEELR